MSKKAQYFIESTLAIIILFAGFFIVFLNLDASHYYPGNMTLNGYEHEYFGVGYRWDDGWDYITSVSHSDHDYFDNLITNIAGGEEKQELIDKLNIKVEMHAKENSDHPSAITMIRIDFRDTKYKNNVFDGAFLQGWTALLDYFERNPGYGLHDIEQIKINIGNKSYDGLYFSSNVTNFVTFSIERNTMALAVIVEGCDLHNIQKVISNYIYEI